MGQYSKKGMYSGYDKNHKERDKKDYYSTPVEEVFNILDKIGFKFVDIPVISSALFLVFIFKYSFRHNYRQ